VLQGRAQHQAAYRVDGRSQPQALIWTAGPEADVAHAPTLLESVDARHVLLDKSLRQ
jgi:hypothetical protein